MRQKAIDKQQLKHWAIALEQELEKHRKRSNDVAELYAYQPLMESIKQAKSETIGEPVDLAGLSYFFFETSLRNFKELTCALSCFSLLLEGYALPLSIKKGL